MGFMSFGGPQETVKYEMPALELGELTARLDGIKESIDKIQVVFEPKIEVPPAQFAMEVDLSTLESALQEIAAKDFAREVVIPAPHVTNNVHVSVGTDLIFALYTISGAIFAMALVDVVRMLR